MGLWQLQLNATDIAAAADIQARTTQRCINVLDGGLSETDHLEPTRQLEHHVEADACDQSAGSKGLPREVERHDRAPRPRGLQLRGHATAALGRPPCWAWCNAATRPTRTRQPHVSLDVRANVRTATIKPIITAKVKSGTQCFTDAYTIYHCTAANYDHRTVNHGVGRPS
jgi:hypothetical protein